MFVPSLEIMTTHHNQYLIFLFLLYSKFLHALVVWRAQGTDNRAQTPGGGGGGDGALDLHFGRYVPRRSEKYGARRENDGLWSGREREKVGLWSGLQRVELVVSGAALTPKRPPNAFLRSGWLHAGGEKTRPGERGEQSRATTRLFW